MTRDNADKTAWAPGETANLAELAARFNISRTLAYELAKRDRLPVPVIPLGRRLVVPRAAMERVLAGERPPFDGAGGGAR